MPVNFSKALLLATVASWLVGCSPSAQGTGTGPASQHKRLVGEMCLHGCEKATVAGVDYRRSGVVGTYHIQTQDLALGEELLELSERLLRQAHIHAKGQ